MITKEQLGYDEEEVKRRIKADGEMINAAKTHAYWLAKSKAINKRLVASQWRLRKRRLHITSVYIAQLQLKQRNDLLKSLNVNKHGEHSKTTPPT